MHGQPRIKTKTSEQIQRENKIKELKKIEEYCTLTNKVMDLYKNNVFNKESLDLAQKLLFQNPDVYSIWNYRRKTLQHMQESGLTELDVDKLFQEELRLIEQIIPMHPKSYWVWHHRRCITSSMNACDWGRELKLCGKMLSADERNFHCWDYRRYVAKQANCTIQDEFQFTTEKIQNNFSNYSAWHQRSALIPQLYAGSELKAFLEKEFELVRNAFYTEPSDSSAWFYHRWLVDKFCEITTEDERAPILQQELNSFKELIEILEAEPDVDKNKVNPLKWPVLTTNYVMTRLQGYDKQIAENFKLLISLDPTRAEYYKSMFENWQQKIK